MLSNGDIIQTETIVTGADGSQESARADKQLSSHFNHHKWKAAIINAGGCLLLRKTIHRQLIVFLCVCCYCKHLWLFYKKRRVRNGGQEELIAFESESDDETMCEPFDIK